MNTKGNQRYHETKKRIERAYVDLVREKGSNKISISEVCKRAKVHRTTFYGHYDDMSGLVKSMTGRFYEDIVAPFVMDDGVSFGEGFLHLFQYIQRNKIYFQIYFQSAEYQDPVSSLLPNVLQEHYGKLLKKVQFASETELYYYQIFFCKGLEAIIRLWLYRDCQESPEEMCEILTREYQIDRSLF